ncbi:hypothetical protein PILCRDRAFT_261375 [Piloderma croceum F 1598]|uniref:Uncharacterized protein n=1 Tax=Piloderma croceum (strain F 1598) TaxID=765440 RepID=A0A0C3G7P4_PILCF|nr:hypothetical protein PILCRDRAFT_261375 [Piloderma croceum F 1598]
MHIDLLHIRGRHIFSPFASVLLFVCFFDLIYISVLAESYSYTNVAFLVHTYKSRTPVQLLQAGTYPIASLPLDLHFSSHPWPRIHYNSTASTHILATYIL